MVHVIFCGDIGNKIGKVWKLKVESVQEAFRAVAANQPSFRSLIAEKGCFLKIVVNGKELRHFNDLTRKRFDLKSVVVTPIVAGSGMFDIFGIILGGLLIAGGILVGVLSGGALLPLAGAMVLAGLSLFMGGILGLLSPTPKIDKPEKQSSTAISNLFSGIDNTLKEGACIPVCYGEMMVGGYLVSNGLFTFKDDFAKLTDTITEICN